jgi:tetratricopeptide (TPR) repeat protein
LFIAQAATAQQVPGCGSLENAYGPYDYQDRTAKREKLPVVESYHFMPRIENPPGGLHKAMGHLDYTLRAFPNHHRALNTLARYAKTTGEVNPRFYSVECYFKRAMAFAPKDADVHMLYGNLLSRVGDKKVALEQYEAALGLDAKSPELRYNTGLLYFELGDIAKATEHARVAYAAGYPLPGLRDKLQSRGVTP